MSARRLVLRRHWPAAAFALLLLVFSLMLLVSRKAPVITGIEPGMAAPGETVVVTGDYFGRNVREGQLLLAGQAPPPSVIQEWSDQRIVFVVPPDAPSGLVNVSNSQGLSSSVLFTNTQTIPTVLRTRPVSVPVEVTSVLPQQPLPGQVVVLSGQGFGRGEGNSAVVLTLSGSGADSAVQMLTPDEAVTWNDQQISFALPSAWGPGTSVSVRTPRGQTPPFDLQAMGPVILSEPRTVSLAFSFEVAVTAGSGTLRLADPSPREPLSAQWRWPAGPLRWTGVTKGPVIGSVETQAILYRHEWRGWPEGVVIPVELTLPPGYTAPEESVTKATGLAAKALVAKWGLETADPLVRAQRLWTGLGQTYLRTSKVAETAFRIPPMGTSLDPFETARLGAYLARLAALPSRTVTGWYLADTGIQPHAWLQVWLAGAGWLDLDPWLALGQSVAELEAGFGDLDNRHLPWSVLPPDVVRVEPASRPVFGPGPSGENRLLAEVTETLEIGSPVWSVKGL